MLGTLHRSALYFLSNRPVAVLCGKKNASEIAAQSGGGRSKRRRATDEEVRSLKCH